jgi:hypothetical protein
MNTSILISSIKASLCLKVYNLHNSWLILPLLENGIYKVFHLMICLSKMVSWLQDHPDLLSWLILKDKLLGGLKIVSLFSTLQA